MTPKQFVAKQLARPKRKRVIPDIVYVRDNRAGDIDMLSKGQYPLYADDVFVAEVYYENAEYFGVDGTGRHKYYPNGVFSI